MFKNKRKTMTKYNIIDKAKYEPLFTKYIKNLKKRYQQQDAKNKKTTYETEEVRKYIENNNQLSGLS